MKSYTKKPQNTNQVRSGATPIAIVKHGLIVTDEDFELTGDSVNIVDYPHKLKKSQLNDLNKLMSSVSKYEDIIDALGRVTGMLFNDFLNSGQNRDTKEAKIYKNILDLYHALCPPSDDGWYNAVDHVLYGKWNKDYNAYERYR
ncbi:MAG: hypothetical protein JWR02_1537 [Mucilaginibacter sp.]|nr:hypothetical protein [Mucilaginibacter sp.]